MIVGFVGVVGSGKDHRAKELVKEGFVQVDFKDALLDMASDLVGYDVRQNYDYFKENLVGLTAPAAIDHKFMQRRPPHQITKEILAGYPQAMTGRLLLQRLGTEVMRKRDPDYWCKEWAKKVKPILQAGGRVAVADVRFPNELHYIGTLAVLCGVKKKLVFCDYHSSRYNANLDHESERLAKYLLKQGYTDGQEIA